MNDSMGLWMLILLGMAVVLGLAGYPHWQAWRRRRVASLVFPPAWRGILRRRVPRVARLPPQRQAQLRQRMLVFLAEVPIIGCAGLQVRDHMRVVIAAEACLLLLGRPEPMFPRLRQVLLYPGSFWVERDHTDAAGVVHHARRAQAGESSSEGQVVLSWQDSHHSAATPDDGFNVVIHEFAHQMDQAGLRILSGAPGANERPAPLAGGAAQAHWAAVMQAEYQACCARHHAGQPDALDPYAATAPEEFFAVASEVFFEQPQALRDAHPSLYQALVAMFGVSPADW